MAGILQTKPSPHGAARNPQISIVDPSIHTHTGRTRMSRLLLHGTGVWSNYCSRFATQYLKGVYTKQKHLRELQKPLELNQKSSGFSANHTPLISFA